jgi:hypothetical protein
MFNVLSLYVNYRLQYDSETVESGLSNTVGFQLKKEGGLV